MNEELPLIGENDRSDVMVQKWGSVYARIAEKFRAHGTRICVADIGTGIVGAGRWGLSIGLQKDLETRQADLLLSDLPGAEIFPGGYGTIIEQHKIFDGTVQPTWVNATYLSCCNEESEESTYTRLRQTSAPILTIADYILRGSSREEVFRVLAMPLETRERELWNDDERFFQNHTKHSRESLRESVRKAGWRISEEILVARGRVFIVAHDPEKPIGREILGV